jgi:hypothetical protein
VKGPTGDELILDPLYVAAVDAAKAAGHAITVAGESAACPQCQWNSRVYDTKNFDKWAEWVTHLQYIIASDLQSERLSDDQLHIVEGFVDSLKEKAVESEKPEKDLVNELAHYKGFSNGAEVIDIIEHLTPNRASAVKYLARAGSKSDDELQDLRKAQRYVQREIALVIAKRDGSSDVSWGPEA